MTEPSAISSSREQSPNFLEQSVPEISRLPLLQVSNLSIAFRQYSRGLRQRLVVAISGLDLEIMAGELLAVVGSSGSGKSLLAHSIVGILPANARVQGSLIFDGKRLTPEIQRQIRGKEIALIPQSVNCLDPLMRVGSQVQLGIGRQPAVTQRKTFERYGLAQQVEKMYPFQLSGGMARRVLVSTAVVSGARLVIADEPTPGLDRSAVADTLSHLRELANQGKAVLLVTHDIESTLSVADRIAVFYAGITLEIAAAKDFAAGPLKLRHPYSRALWHALPSNGFESLAGFQPSSLATSTDKMGANLILNNCPFHVRCAQATSKCKERLPSFRKLREGMVRCNHAT